MPYVKKADRERLGLSADGTPMAKETTPTTTQEKPPAPTPKAADSRVEDLENMVRGLTDQVRALTTGRRNGVTQRNRTREHVATMREFEQDGEVKGLVTKLYGVKEVKDKTENKRFYGICSVDVLDPVTKKTTTYRDVDYLDFLNNAKKVLVKILNWSKETRYAVEAVGPLYKQTDQNYFLQEAEHEFEVGYTLHAFTLEVKEGAYEGTVIETDDKALNI